MKAVIHYARFDREMEHYIEDLVRDDGIRIDTQSILPGDIAKTWSENKWQKAGMLKPGQIIHTVKKHHFYREWFAIMELRDAQDSLLGYYCDVVTPLVKRDDGYYLQDMVLDLWVFPDGSFMELDRDELSALVQDGKVNAEDQHKAEEILRRMVAEAREGIFPAHYLR